MLDKFKEELAREGKAPNTIQTYSQNIQLFLDWLCVSTGEHECIKISTFDTREYRSYLINVKKQQPNTVNAKLQAVQMYADFLHRQGIQDQIKVQRQKAVPNYSVRILNKSDLYKCRRWASNYASPRDAAVFELLLNTGLRASEAAALTMDDIEISERKGSVTVRNGKGGKTRTVPLNVDARNALQRYLSVRPADSEGYLFLGQRGRITRSCIFDIVQRISTRAIGQAVPPHTIRHTTFSRMAKSGIDLSTIADLAGHSDPKITHRYYIATSEEDRQNAVDSLNF